MISLLVMARDGGMTRDKLAALLWPDFPPDRARHSLTQALYASRKAAGVDDLFFVSENIRLNFDHVGGDAIEFESAISHGNLDEAAKLYRGPFLDGFYLPSTEFNGWLDAERARLEDLAVRALEQVIEQREHSGDYQAAVETARRLAAMRPTDATIAIKLMRLLSEAGDRPSAIAHAHTYETLVRDRFDAAPDARVLAFAEELRAAPSLPEVTVPPDVRAEADEVSKLSVAQPASTTFHFRKWWMTIAASVLVLAVFIAWLLRSRTADAPSQPLAQDVVIAPFRVAGASPELQYLADGMIELLSTRLADDTTDRAMDAAAVLRAWRSARATPSDILTVDSQLSVGRRLRAGRIIAGSVVGRPSQLVIHATVRSTETGRTISSASVEGSADTLTALVDELARRLLVKQIGDDESLAERTTRSLPALRLYVAGSTAAGRGDYAIAFRHYNRAIELDSTFALAALKLGMAAARLGEFDVQRRALNLAWQSRAMLTQRDTVLLSAMLGPRYPAVSTVMESVVAWNRAARLAASRAEAWYGLASAHYKALRIGDVSDSEILIASLNRAVQLDSGYVVARSLLAKMRGERYVAYPANPLTAGPYASRAFALTAQAVGARLDESGRVLAALQDRASDASQALSLMIAEHSMHTLQGRPNAALETTRRMQRVSPATRLHLRLRVLDALYGEGDRVVAAAAARQLQADPEVMAGLSVDACALAQWELAIGDTTASRRLIAQGAATGSATQVPAAETRTIVCRALIDAGISVLSADTLTKHRLAQLDSLDFTSIAAGDAATYAHIAIARWYARLGLPAQAFKAIKQEPLPATLWPRYRATALSLRAQIALQLGLQGEAREALEEYLRFRDAPEPQLGDAAAAARATLLSLTSD